MDKFRYTNSPEPIFVLFSYYNFTIHLPHSGEKTFDERRRRLVPPLKLASRPRIQICIRKLNYIACVWQQFALYFLALILAAEKEYGGKIEISFLYSLKYISIAVFVIRKRSQSLFFSQIFPVLPTYSSPSDCLGLCRASRVSFLLMFRSRYKWLPPPSLPPLYSQRNCRFVFRAILSKLLIAFEFIIKRFTMFYFVKNKLLIETSGVLMAKSI